MRRYGLFICLIFVGIIALYIQVGKLGGGPQLVEDKFMSLELRATEAIKHDRPDLALKYYDKAIRTAEKANYPERKKKYMQLKAQLPQTH